MIFPHPKPTQKPKAKAAPRPRKPVRKVNRKRQKKNAPRVYGPAAFKAWLHKQPCCVCGAGPVEMHHVRGGGAGRKSDFTLTVALCRSANFRRGCHDTLHHIGRLTFESVKGVDLEALAAAAQEQFLIVSQASRGAKA